MIKHCAFALALFLALTSLSACGKKGPLDVPEGASYPQPYPRP
ncbi:MAG: lipoprotein [Rhodospirillaceae bacterium]